MPDDPIHSQQATVLPIPDCNSAAWRGVPPVLRTLLLSDGTVTTFLAAYFGEAIQINVIAHEHRDFGELPPLEIVAGTTILRRITTFQGAQTGRIFCQAVSYLRAELLWPGAADDLLQGRVGVGELLRTNRIETYREILGVERSAANDGQTIALKLKADDDLVTRRYRVYVKRTPCLYITDTYPVMLFN